MRNMHLQSPATTFRKSRNLQNVVEVELPLTLVARDWLPLKSLVYTSLCKAAFEVARFLMWDDVTVDALD